MSPPISDSYPHPRMARLLLVRHAPTHETGTRLTGRAPGVSLSPRGRAEAETAAKTLLSTPLSAIYTSPIDRCRETTEIIASDRQLTPNIEKGVTEIDFGSWTGRTLKSLQRNSRWNTVRNVPSRFTFPDGESFVDAQSRGVTAIERIAATAKRSTVVVVSHADVIKLVLSHYLGQPLDLFQRVVVETTSISELVLSPGRAPQVASINGRGS